MKHYIAVAWMILMCVTTGADAVYKKDAQRHNSANCHMEYPGQPRWYDRCYKAKRSAHRQMEKLYRNGWRKEVNHCYRENPGVALGVDYHAALICFGIERRRIIKERQQKKKR